MKYPLSLRLGEWLYENLYFVYQPLYFWYKQRNEKQEIQLIRQLIKKGDVIIDVGANVGFYTKLFSQLTGNTGKVYAFEPDINNFNKLKNNTRHLNNVIIENKAISDTTATLKLYQSKLNVDHRTYLSDEFSSDKYIEIPAIKLDDYIQNQPVHLLKIDVQGFEPFVLKGAENILSNSSQIKLISEFWPYGLKQAGTSAQEYFNLLQNHFKKIYLLHKHQLQEINLSDVQKLPVQSNVYYNLFAEK